MTRFIFATCIAAAAQCALADGTITPRRGSVVPVGRVVGVSVEGVALAADLGDSVIVPWSRVERVEGELAPIAAYFKPLADQAWRAAGRLRRADLANAEPLLDQLFETYRLHSGPTASEVAAGLLRCRLSRGAQTAAVGPWLTWVRCGIVDAAGATADGPAAPAPTTSSASNAVHYGPWLNGAIPPIWLETPALQVMARESTLLPALASDATPPGKEPQQRAELFAAFYLASARAECGMDFTMPDIGAKPAPDVLLVARVIRSRAGSDSERAEARQWLSDSIRRKPEPWAEVWMRVALGRSLLKEADADQKLLGIAELLEIPARLDAPCPYLTGVALAESAAGLAALGDAKGAARVRDELLNRWPGHPAADWPGLRAAAAVAPQPASPAGPSHK